MHGRGRGGSARIAGTAPTGGIAAQLHAATGGDPDLLSVETGANHAEAFPLEQCRQLGAGVGDRQDRRSRGENVCDLRWEQAAGMLRPAATNRWRSCTHFSAPATCRRDRLDGAWPALFHRRSQTFSPRDRRSCDHPPRHRGWRTLLERERLGVICPSLDGEEIRVAARRGVELGRDPACRERCRNTRGPTSPAAVRWSGS